MIVSVEQLIDVLRAAERPMQAVSIAYRCGLQLPHETARRRVRETVEAARAAGNQVCADTIHGYWLASRTEEFEAYLGRRREEGVRELGRVAKAKRRARAEEPGLFGGGDSTEAFKR